MPVDSSTFDADIAIIRARRKGGIRLGSEVPQVERIPLDSPSLMRITDGGVPIGRVTRLWGPPSAGKSLLVYFIIASGQRLRTARFPDGLKSTFWNVEGTFDGMLASQIGVDTAALGVEDADVIEDIAGELSLLLRSCHLHAIDSTSSAKTRDELAANPDDWQQMLEARAWKRAWRRIEHAFDSEENAIILIDHATENKQTKARRPAGGKVLDHASSLSLELSSGGWLFYHPVDGHLEKSDKIKDEVGLSPNGVIEPDGCEIKVRVSKSKICRPLRAAVLRFDFHTCKFDTVFELLDAARFFDADGHPAHRSGNDAIMQRTSAKGGWYRHNGNSINGERAVRKIIAEDPDLQETIRTAMLAQGW